jgi:hypothetical protein
MIGVIMKVVRVVNGSAPAGAVAIGRGTVWGNPFIIGEDGDREAVVSKFYHYAKWRLEREPNWLKPLSGKDLACYCSPKMCHGHAIMALIERMEEPLPANEEECPCFMGGSCPTDYKHEGE